MKEKYCELFIECVLFCEDVITGSAEFREVDPTKDDPFYIGG